MGSHRTLLALAVVAACGSKSPPASNHGGASSKAVTDEASAIKVLERRFGTKCVGYALEEQTSAGFDIAQREVHGGDCPGDPQTSPVSARYRVARDGKVSKLDPVSAEWQPLP